MKNTNLIVQCRRVSFLKFNLLKQKLSSATVRKNGVSINWPSYRPQFSPLEHEYCQRSPSEATLWDTSLHPKQICHPAQMFRMILSLTLPENTIKGKGEKNAEFTSWDRNQREPHPQSKSQPQRRTPSLAPRFDDGSCASLLRWTHSTGWPDSQLNDG